MNNYFPSSYFNMREQSSPSFGSEADFLDEEIDLIDCHMSIPTSMQSDIKKFSSYYATWSQNTELMSSVDDMILDSSYQSIIGMGEKAIPFILNCLQKKNDHWHWALKFISGEDPVQYRDRGNMEAMRKSWLEWGYENNYI